MRPAAGVLSWAAFDARRALVALALLGTAATVVSNALGGVIVDPSITLTREASEVEAGGHAHYAYHLAAGTEFVFTLGAASWRGTPLRIWLLDEPNYRNLSAGRPFSYVEEGSGLAQRFAQFTFAVSRTDVYHIIIDNTEARVSRQLRIYAYANLPEPSAADAQAQRAYEQFYENLRALFEFEDIDIVITRCGRVNAFSTPRRVVICKEFDELLAQGPTPGLRLFVLLHEAAHTFLYAWGYRSIYASQWMTDRLAATLTALMGHEDSVAEAARWFASNRWLDEPSSLDAQFAMQKQRAQRLEEWLTEEITLDLSWTRRIVFPKMRTAALESMLARSDLEPRTRRRIEAELHERRNAAP